MGAKRPVSLLGNAKRKNAAALATNPVRDPRFDAKCGEFDAQKFKENFGFVDDIKERELGELKERLKTVEDFKEQKKIKYLIQRMQNQSTEKRKRKIRETMRDEERQEIVQAKREKRQPIYKTDRELFGERERERRKTKSTVYEYIYLYFMYCFVFRRTQSPGIGFAVPGAEGNGETEQASGEETQEECVARSKEIQL